MLLVGVENILRRGQFRHVFVTDSTDSAEEVSKVVLLREASQLRDVVQAHIDDLLHSGFRDAREERLRCRLGESNRVELQCPTPRASWLLSASFSE